MRYTIVRVISCAGQKEEPGPVIDYTTDINEAHRRQANWYGPLVSVLGCQCQVEIRETP